MKKSGGFGPLHGMYFFGAEQLAADGPIALFDFHDPNPGDGAERFAFDGDHGLGDLFDEVALLIGGEDVLD
jgi:hypothetical protein